MQLPIRFVGIVAERKELATHEDIAAPSCPHSPNTPPWPTILMIVFFGVYIMSKYDSFRRKTVLSYIQDKYHSGHGRVDPAGTGPAPLFCRSSNPKLRRCVSLFWVRTLHYFTVNVQLVSPAIRSQQRKMSLLLLCNTRRGNSAFPYAGTRLQTDMIKEKTRLQL